MRSAAVLAVMLVLATGARLRAEDAWWAKDKAAHFGATSGLAAGGYAAGALVFEARDTRVASGLVLALGAGAAKEWRDRARGGTASWRDFTWDAAGAATGVAMAWLIDRARHRRPHRTTTPLPAPQWGWSHFLAPSPFRLPTSSERYP